jgi:hypothetical protein
MPRRVHRIAVIAATLVGVATMFVTAAPASAGLVLPFENWAVWGSVTDKKLNETITLPKGATFNGSANLTTVTDTEIVGTLGGSLFVPPFKAKLKLGGLVPIEVGVTLTQVGESEGTISTVPPANCGRTRYGGVCTTLSITSKAVLGISGAGIGGVELPTECQTAEPLVLHLSDTLPFGDVSEPHFAGIVTIPSVTCNGLDGLVLGPVVTALMSGPENPYVLNIGPHEPRAPKVVTAAAHSVSQISAMMFGTVNPEGEPLTNCQFEYGLSLSYGKRAPCVGPPGSAPFVSARAVSVSENTQYHFRLAATNSIGTSYANDETFTTLGESGSPEYGQCVAQKKAEYSSASCVVKSKPKHGSFEWRPGPAATCVEQEKGEYTESACKTKSKKAKTGEFEAAPGPKYTSSSGSVTLEAPELGASGTSVVCAASTAAGEVTGTKTGVEQVRFAGCEASGKKCTSEGSNSTPSGEAGVIVTNRLHTRLLGPVESKVLTEFVSSEHEPYAAEFGCEGPLFRITGWLSGVDGGNVNAMSSTSSTTFSSVVSGEGEQALYSELSENKGTSWIGPDSSALITVANNTSASQTEIKP